MPAEESRKKIIQYKDLFVGDFWRYFLKAIWLFFPPILFIIFAYLCFWKLTQGRDVMIITLENRKVFGLFLLALLFWMMITWYTTRLVAKAKQLQSPDDHLMWLTLRVQGPRILSFTCVTIIILGFFQLNYPETPKLSTTICNILFWLSFSWYFFVYQLWNWLLKQDNEKTIRDKIKFWQRIRLTTYIIILAATLIVVLYKWVWGLILLLMAYQVAFVIIVLIRRNIIDAKDEYSFKNPQRYQIQSNEISTWQKIKQLVTDKEDRQYFQALNIVAFFGGIVYFSTIFSVQFSTWIGSFPFLILAFGVLVGLGNVVALLSVLARFNFHVLLLTLAFLVGYISEPHYTRLPKKELGSVRFDNRQTLQQYFDQWLNDSTRKKMLLDSSTEKYPVYFVMANGGASRSGYWAASVLSRMEDETGGRFSNHLFCLSGASGGSVGNATFFSLLRSKNELAKFDTAANRDVKATQAYLRSDFLTYTLARTLGPDIFRNFITLYNVNDRASALSFALENAAGKKVFLNDSMGVSFSDIITQKDKPYPLPLLLINTTRMQDGSPGVISNIKIEDPVFNKRIDVLSLLDEKKDMKLSTGVVLGASFPYLSPAGRIDHKPCDTCAVQPSYFVDGGYFDNSGSGAVFEIIFALKQMLEMPEYSAFKNKLDFTIIHITNDPSEEVELTPVNPFANDLAAPVKTLLGAYGTQTSVNDLRLQKYIASIYKEDIGTGHYKRISLYRDKDPMDYTMSWVISKYVLDAMDKRLYDHHMLNSFITEMNDSLK
ncbi:MAG: patatin-like phospholipase family protein [Ferruginibacter sp.]